GQGKQGSWQSSTFKLIVTARWSGVSWISRGRRQEGPGQAPDSDAGSGAGVHQGSAVPAVPGAQATAARGLGSAGDRATAARSSHTTPAPPASRASRPLWNGGRGP